MAEDIATETWLDVKSITGVPVIKIYKFVTMEGVRRVLGVL